MQRLILDANILVVFIIGSIDSGLLGRAKRVKEYQPSDYRLLLTFISLFGEVLVLPNTVSEASNLLGQLKGDRRDECLLGLAALATTAAERYVPSANAVQQPDFMALGITDAAILCALDDQTSLLTADEDLYVAAIGRRGQAAYFNDLRS